MVHCIHGSKPSLPSVHQRSTDSCHLYLSFPATTFFGKLFFYTAFAGAPELRGIGGGISLPPLPLLYGGARGQKNALFYITIKLHLHQNSVIHKRRIDEVSTKEVAKEFVEINEQPRIYFRQFE